MIRKEKVVELIDQIPHIEQFFHKGDTGSFATYNISERVRVTSSVRMEMIYDAPEFKQWRDELLLELIAHNDDDYIKDICELLANFTGFGDKKRFENLVSKLNVLKNNIDKYNYISEACDGKNECQSEKRMLDVIQRAIVKLQKNYENYDFNDEDTMNDYVRDIVGEHFEVKDQTRQGISENGVNAGEIDIQICKDGLPFTMVEGLVLSYLNKKYLDSHINKVLSLYDPNGCPCVILLIYQTGVKFDSFWNKLKVYVDKYIFPYERVSDIFDGETGYAEIKHAWLALKRNDMDITVHIYAAHLKNENTKV